MVKPEQNTAQQNDINMSTQWRHMRNGVSKLDCLLKRFAQANNKKMTNSQGFTILSFVPKSASDSPYKELARLNVFVGHDVIILWDILCHPPFAPLVG